MADTFLLPRHIKPRRRQLLRDLTVRDFTGGWNVVDNDLNLSSKYSVISENMQIGPDGSQEVRQGTRLFADVSDHMDEIVNIAYFNGYIIAVGTNGIVVQIDGSGKVDEIFNEDIGDGLSGSPGPWSTSTTFVSFAEFNGELIICNGINKPLIVSNSMSVTYLNDPATGSNANTPICRYVVAHDRYLVMSGNPDATDRIHITSTDTSGVFAGDPGPNDAVDVDLGSRVPSGNSIVRGLGRFRDKLVVAFDDAILPGTLGSFDVADHVPTFDDAISEVGSIAHRVIQSLGEDMLFLDQTGVSSVSRALFTGNVATERESYLVDPEIQLTLGQINSTVLLEDAVFAVYDSTNSSYMVMIPNAPDSSQVTGTRCYVRKKIKKLKVDAWTEYTNWNWSGACRSALKRVFFSHGDGVFIFGRQSDPISKDREGYEEMFDDDTPFTDYTGFTPISDVDNSGISIPFVWELPWGDNGDRFGVKGSRFINFDTEGSDTFTVSMYVDNIYEDVVDPGETFEEDGQLFTDGTGFDIGLLDPTLSMEFIAGTAPGFGLDSFGDYFGGGRPTRHEGLYAWTTKYKLFKLRMEGDARKPLKFISVSMAYTSTSTIRR